MPVASQPGPQPRRAWRFLRKTLIGLAALATLIAIAYTEENWRGKRDWANTKRELAAKGIETDWTKLIPPPVPDESNFFAISDMQAWFVGREPIYKSNTLAKRLENRKNAFNPPHITVAELSIVSPADAPSGGAINLDDPAGRARIKNALMTAAGRSSLGPIGEFFTAESPGNYKPVKLAIYSAKPIDETSLAAAFPKLVGGPLSRLHIEKADSSQITLRVDPIAVRDYLEWTQRYTPEFDSIREALKRPYARMNGSYEKPAEIPIPNFMAIRDMSQTLVAQAQCHLLLHEPGKAVEDLTLMHDLSRILESRPTGAPKILISAMINVAVQGLYANTITEGFRLNEWRDQDLVALQQQLGEVDLFPEVHGALDGEIANITRTLETTKLITLYYPTDGTRESSFRRLLCASVPRGWVSQNLVIYARHMIAVTECSDWTNHIVFPERCANTMKMIEREFDHRTPYNFIALIAVPNTEKAYRSTAENQTKINQATLACALERFKNARGHYPEALDELKPEFMANIPHDIIGGQPLHYQRKGDIFLLYSVGWNGTDDGGVPGKTQEDGDWVWNAPM